MIEEHSPHLHSMPDLPEPSKRRRTPSQYATQIDHFKNVPPLSHRTSPPKGPRTSSLAPFLPPPASTPSRCASYPTAPLSI